MSVRDFCVLLQFPNAMSRTNTGLLDIIKHISDVIICIFDAQTQQTLLCCCTDICDLLQSVYHVNAPLVVVRTVWTEP